MDNYITLPIKKCTSFNHYVQHFCLPIKQTCDDTVIDGFFVECGDQFNCTKMCTTDKLSFIDMPFDGKLMFQTNFNIKTDKLWGVDIIIKLYDLGNNLISDEHTSFASKWVIGKSTKGGYQTIEIDFSLVPIICGYFEISFGDITFCTEYFRKEDCASFVEIEGIVNGTDCWNNYYGLTQTSFTGTNFAYSNKIYLKGMTKLFSVSNTNLETLRFYPSELVGPFIAKYITNKILRQSKVSINGDIWSTKDTTLTVREKSSMFFPVIEFERKVCDTSFGCSN